MIQAPNFDSIHATRLTAVTGGGPSLGERSSPLLPSLPDDPNSWAAPLGRSSPQAVPNSSYWDEIDAGMERMPANPGMDMGMSKEPYSGTVGSDLDI